MVTQHPSGSNPAPDVLSGPLMHTGAWEPARDAESVLCEARRSCPPFTLPAGALRVRRLRLACYEDYDLVEIGPVDTAGDGTPLWLYGLYAEGDFCPLDRDGRAFDWVSDRAPLVLTKESVETYAQLRLSLELPALFPEFTDAEATAGSGDSVRPAAIVTDAKQLPVDLDKLDEQTRKQVNKLIGASPLECSPVGAYGVSVRAFLLRGDNVRLIRARTIIERDGVPFLPRSGVSCCDLPARRGGRPLGRIRPRSRCDRVIPIAAWEDLDPRDSDALRQTLVDQYELEDPQRLALR